ncbi:MAG: hypothetical protein GF417_01650 [Candidatus Latescibacteria bacterium]|nr:hypothetical protein [bacterium]MBD3423131.1 hypothetical protein [Candidatus Latescibacterota bacterium]
MIYRTVILLYSALVRAIQALSGAAGLFNSKFARRASARRRIRARWITGAGSFSPGSRKIWFHVASVGEFLQAKPVISLLTENDSTEIEIALTFSSPSGMENYRKFLADSESDMIKFVDYLPMDTPANARFCLDTLEPDLIVYVKYDLWPNLILAASGRGIRQILIAAGLSESSGRYSRAGSWFYGPLYSALELISASTDEEAERFRKCSPGASIITGGDTKFDQVYRRITEGGSALPVPALPSGSEYIIAGSTWPGDESLLLNGYSVLKKRFSNLSLIIAPHEPTPERVAEVIDRGRARSLSPAALSNLDEGMNPPVIIADGIGYLAELYRAGIIAYVGGAFSAGVHNVLEPAVLGLPVLFGPGIDNSHEAKELAALGAGSVVESPERLVEEVSAMLSDRDLIVRRGRTGRDYIESNLGASIKYRDLIFDFME